MKRPCSNASQTSIIKMREFHPILLKALNFNWMKQSVLLFLILFGANSLVKGQELVEKEGVYFLQGEFFSGKWTTNFDNGGIKMEAHFKNGLKNGKTKIWYEDGQINEIRSYKKNEMHGKWLMYNNHNIKISVARYKKGKKHGKWTIWNDYGNLLYSLEYTNGEKSGTWKNYNEKGKLVNERKY